MAIAEMPRDPNQVKRIAAADFNQWLRRGHDFDEAPVLQDQGIAAAQRNRNFKIEQKFESARAGHRHAPPMAVVEIEDHGIGRRLLRPGVLRPDLSGADHC